MTRVSVRFVRSCVVDTGATRCSYHAGAVAAFREALVHRLVRDGDAVIVEDATSPAARHGGQGHPAPEFAEAVHPGIERR